MKLFKNRKETIWIRRPKNLLSFRNVLAVVCSLPCAHNKPDYVACISKVRRIPSKKKETRGEREREDTGGERKKLAVELLQRFISCMFCLVCCRCFRPVKRRKTSAAQSSSVLCICLLADFFSFTRISDQNNQDAVSRDHMFNEHLNASFALTIFPYEFVN